MNGIYGWKPSHGGLKSDDFPFRKFRTAQPWKVFVGWERLNQPHRTPLEKTVIQQFGVFTVNMCPLIDRHFKNTTEIEDGFGLRKNMLGNGYLHLGNRSKHLVTSNDVRFGVRSLPGCERHQRFPLQKLEQRFAQEDLLSI